MHKVNFLPRAYREESYNKMIKFLVFIFIVLVMLVLVKIFYDKKELNEVDKRIENVNSIVSRDIKKIKVDVKKDNSVKTFINFYKFISPYVNCETLKVYGKNIVLDGKSNNMEDYISFLEKIEKNSDYIIKDFKELQRKEESVKFSMELEVIK